MGTLRGNAAHRLQRACRSQTKTTVSAASQEHKLTRTHAKRSNAHEPHQAGTGPASHLGTWPGGPCYSHASRWPALPGAGTALSPVLEDSGSKPTASPDASLSPSKASRSQQPDTVPRCLPKIIQT